MILKGSIGTTFRDRRKAMKKRVCEMAESLGVSRQAYTRMESGDIGVSVDMMMRACRELELKVLLVPEEIYDPMKSELFEDKALSLPPR